jgi:arylsulfatase A-like enzyme
MMRELWRLFVYLVLLVLLVVGSGELQAAERNILLIIADDVGVDAAAFYPTSADRRVTTPPAPPTPNLARLAQNGVLFRRAWATPWCSPTRATIVTGRYPFRTGVGDPLPKDPAKPSPGLPLDEFALPEAFQKGDPRYRLAHIGKWHVSRDPDPADDREPNQHGWPHFAGPDPDLPFLPSFYAWPKTVDGVTRQSTVYATTDQVNEAVVFIRDAKEEGRPYFVWLAFSASHSPYEKPPNELHSKDSLPSSGAPRRAYYEAMVEAMDTEIGRLLNDVNLADTTVIFLGDNGTPAEVTVQPYDRKKAKGTPYQGGVRVPLLAAGAGVVDPGRIVDRLVSTVDLYPTILELAGINPSDVLPAGTKIDGVSIVPYLGNRVGASVRESVYTEEFPDCFNKDYERAIGNCCYKLIRRANGSREFYDLRADPYETRNLLAKKLTLVQRKNLNSLSQQLDSLLAGAVPPPACRTAAGSMAATGELLVSP